MKIESIINVLDIMVRKLERHSKGNSWTEGYKTGLKHAIAVLEGKTITPIGEGDKN